MSSDITKQLPCKALRSGTLAFQMGKLRLRDKGDWAEVPEKVSGMRWRSCGLLPADHAFWGASCLQVMHLSNSGSVHRPSSRRAARQLKKLGRDYFWRQ